MPRNSRNLWAFLVCIAPQRGRPEVEPRAHDWLWSPWVGGVPNWQCPDENRKLVYGRRLERGERIVSSSKVLLERDGGCCDSGRVVSHMDCLYSIEVQSNFVHSETFQDRYLGRCI